MPNTDVHYLGETPERTYALRIINIFAVRLILRRLAVRRSRQKRPEGSWAVCRPAAFRISMKKSAAILSFPATFVQQRRSAWVTRCIRNRGLAPSHLFRRV
jgi:hypothetical protein